MSHCHQSQMTVAARLTPRLPSHVNRAVARWCGRMSTVPLRAPSQVMACDHLSLPSFRIVMIIDTALLCQLKRSARSRVQDCHHTQNTCDLHDASCPHNDAAARVCTRRVALPPLLSCCRCRAAAAAVCRYSCLLQLPQQPHCCVTVFVNAAAGSG